MLAPVGALVLALVFLTLGIANAPADVLDSLAIPGLVVLGAPIALGMLMIRGSQAMRTHRYRIDPGGAPAAAILHEVAHADKGAQFGGRTVRGRVYPNGSGYVDVRLPAGAPIEHHVAVDMAGARGEGEYFWTSPHARGDRANAAWRVAHLPHEERDRVYREAYRLSAPRWWVSGSASSVRRALEQRGAYR
jgi:hypothetical protein